MHYRFHAALQPALQFRLVFRASRSQRCSGTTGRATLQPVDYRYCSPHYRFPVATVTLQSHYRNLGNYRYTTVTLQHGACTTARRRTTACAEIRKRSTSAQWENHPPKKPTCFCNSDDPKLSRLRRRYIIFHTQHTPPTWRLREHIFSPSTFPPIFFLIESTFLCHSITSSLVSLDLLTLKKT